MNKLKGFAVGWGIAWLIVTGVGFVVSKNLVSEAEAQGIRSASSPATTVSTGGVTTGTQSFAGAKTFTTSGTTSVDLTVTQAASKMAVSIPTTGAISFNGDAVGISNTSGGSAVYDDNSDLVLAYGNQGRLKVNHGSGEVVLLLGLDSPKVKFGGVLVFSGTAPTVSSGFGTSPSITAGRATAFRLNVGTGGSASSGVIALPTAAVGWNCTCADLTTQSTTVFLCKQTASSTTTATITNYNTAGSAAAWVASDVLAVSCTAL